MYLQVWVIIDIGVVYKYSLTVFFHLVIRLTTLRKQICFYKRGNIT
jgi:hypothetical protein